MKRMIWGLAVLLSFVPAAQAGLIGLSSSSPGSVYSVDSATGNATLLATLSGTTGTSLVGLEYLSGTVYTTDVVTEGGLRFGTINLTTGAFTVINSQGGSFNWQSLAGNPVANVLYTVDITTLRSVTPGGVITTIGNTGQFMVGLAYDANHGILYGVSTSNLYTINTSTGAATLVGSLGTANFRAGLAYDSDADVLYMNLGDPNFALYRLNTTTGAATLVGANGATAGSGIDGLAYIPNAAAVPEPASMALLALSAFGAAGYTWRRRRQSV